MRADSTISFQKRPSCRPCRRGRAGYRGRRQPLRDHVTAHPTAAWTLQQLREVVWLEERYEYLIHDRDSIFAKHLDESIKRLGVKVLKSPPHSPMANAICDALPAQFVENVWTG
jgi:hypothetical protein